ncbi:MAG: hypothetical protein IPJ94_26770 [Chloroflexi bacterium]|nr:hypothetical protein [Chloroflexota bacterium]
MKTLTPISSGKKKTITIKKKIARREAWIEALEAGSNPFDEETLATLRSN